MIQKRPNGVRAVGTILDWGWRRLHSSDSGRLDAELLLAGAVGNPRTWVLAHPDADLSLAEVRRYRRDVLRRAAGVPVAYLRGSVEWWDLELEVTPDVLIPRPETELLLEATLDLARKGSATIVADIGTGSGALAIALARALRPVKVYGVDTSEAALSVAARNRARYALDDHVVLTRGGLLSPLTEMPHVIVANLPYLSDKMMTEIDAGVRHEPATALHGGPTGTELYRALFKEVAARGWTSSLVIEIDPRQADAIRILISQALPSAHVSLTKDYSGRDRIAVVQTDARKIAIVSDAGKVTDGG